MHSMNFVQSKNLYPPVCAISQNLLAPTSTPPFVHFVVQTQYIERLCYIAKKMRLDESFWMHRSKASGRSFLAINGRFRYCTKGGVKVPQDVGNAQVQ